LRLELETAHGPQLAIPAWTSVLGGTDGRPRPFSKLALLYRRTGFMTQRRLSSHVAILASLALLVAIPAFAGSGVITNGIDLWRTPGTGGTFVDFAREPLPAGFFCASSAPFTGRIVFTGVPVKTRPASVLGGADTIIQRLDDAAFTKGLPAVHPFALRGDDGAVRQVDGSFFSGQDVATTRIQVKAISFAGVRPVATGCGSYSVRASLAGDQPITRMVIVRDRENGGRFYAPLALNVRLTFTPVAGGAPVEVMRSIRFPAKALSVWTEAPGRRAAYNSFVSVDSDADGAVDVMLPGTSNFAAGFKGLPSHGRGAAEKATYIGTPYCDGSGFYYDVHCHDAGPVLIE